MIIYLFYFLVLTIGFYLGWLIKGISIKNKVPDVPKRRGLFLKDYTAEGTGVVGSFESIYEILELESTDTMSKIKVISVKSSNSKYNSGFYVDKLKDMIDDSWVNTSDIKWITTVSDMRANKIDALLK